MVHVEQPLGPHLLPGQAIVDTSPMGGALSTGRVLPRLLKGLSPLAIVVGVVVVGCLCVCVCLVVVSLFSCYVSCVCFV